MKKVVSTIIILMLIFTFACSGGSKWPTGEAASHLPKPDTGKIDRVSEYSGSLSIRVKNIDAVAFESYVKKCADAGFTIEASKDSSYEAFNSEGYSFRLYCVCFPSTIPVLTNILRKEIAPSGAISYTEKYPFKQIS